jgi:hypothetical protein
LVARGFNILYRIETFNTKFRKTCPAGDSSPEHRLQGKLLQQAGEWLEQVGCGCF